MNQPGVNRGRIKVQRRQRRLPEGQFRTRCFGCYRPIANCFCAAIPQIDNQTDVLILQHRRERSHPFNTARIVDRALQRCQLLHNHSERFAELELPIRPRAGLLYPGKGSRLLSDLDPENRPEQLVILDGTWHHAKTLFRDIPQLRDLPQYRLAPSSPGQFRIRLEPTDTSLSTLEATVQALQQLEPGTKQLETLLTVFNTMVEQQLAHPQAKYGNDQPKPKIHNLNAPNIFSGDLSNIVVAYGETMPGNDQQSDWHPNGRNCLLPVYWVAQRMVASNSDSRSANSFAQFICPAFPITERFLDFMDLKQSDFDQAVSIESFRREWHRFLEPDDLLVVHSHNIARLLENAGVRVRKYEVLKSINHDPKSEFRTLKEFFASRSFPVAEVTQTGRAGQRLANAMTMVRFLNSRLD